MVHAAGFARAAAGIANHQALDAFQPIQQIARCAGEMDGHIFLMSTLNAFRHNRPKVAERRLAALYDPLVQCGRR